MLSHRWLENSTRHLIQTLMYASGAPARGLDLEPFGTPTGAPNGGFLSATNHGRGLRPTDPPLCPQLRLDLLYYLESILMMIRIVPIHDQRI